MCAGQCVGEEDGRHAFLWMWIINALVLFTAIVNARNILGGLQEQRSTLKVGVIKLFAVSLILSCFFAM